MKVLKIFGIAIGLAILIFFSIKKINPLLKLDGYTGLFLRVLLTTDDSEYSKNYSHHKFLQIENGMSVSQVYEILGKPIRADVNGNEYYCLWYSWSPHSTHYRRRNIIFENNRVSLIQSEFYVD
ncbi:outer membrane protein assembly factor BamE domain-containing protein [Flavobacterium orientale]|uniref:Outer membrane protein assembly factor BamE domain-containing protein n=1 Tax=Flavobacterium orientale TaxID=1756020 RepID=A0A916Y4E7_9FLAO|nr:outer membrane protein assembly factor BamE [Flavobacterium orientale]GGD30551.1 hypothetical protein GCM10011343_20940 [Flavobacterium orientale]